MCKALEVLNRLHGDGKLNYEVYDELYEAIEQGLQDAEEKQWRVGYCLVRREIAPWLIGRYAFSADTPPDLKRVYKNLTDEGRDNGWDVSR